MLHVIECVSDGIFWRIQNHSWACPAHDFTNLFTLFWSITVSGTILTRSLLLSILAMIQALTSILSQKSVFLWHCVLFQMMPAIKPYHLTDGLLLSLYPGHICLFFHVTINESHFLGFLLVHSLNLPFIHSFQYFHPPVVHSAKKISTGWKNRRISLASSVLRPNASMWFTYWLMLPGKMAT